MRSLFHRHDPAPGRVVANDRVERLRDLMKLPSLEEIFRELVVEEDTESVAKDIVQVMKLRHEGRHAGLGSTPNARSRG